MSPPPLRPTSAQPNSPIPRGAHSNKKKKKSSSSLKARDEAPVASGSGGEGGKDDGEASDSHSGGGGSTFVASGKTDAQRRFEEVQKKRVRPPRGPGRRDVAKTLNVTWSRLQLLEKAAKAAAKTHKERVAEFNEKLENLSEHYDIPKVRRGALCGGPLGVEPWELTLVACAGRTRLVVSRGDSPSSALVATLFVQPSSTLGSPIAPSPPFAASPSRTMRRLE